MVAFDQDILNNTPDAEMDKRLAVKFYKKAIFNGFLSKKEGRNIYDDVDYVSIRIPGDNTTVIERKVTDKDKERFAILWQRYLDKEESTQNGIPLAMMPGISPAQVENLKGYQVYTVEQLAGLGEKAIQKIPLVRGLVDEAIKFLDGNKYTSSLEERLKAMEAELAKYKGGGNESAIDNSERERGNGTGGVTSNGNRKQRQVRKKAAVTAK